jgi:hypothetical protein
MGLLYDMFVSELDGGEDVELVNVVIEKAREANGTVSADCRNLYLVELKRHLHSLAKYYLHAAMPTRELNGQGGVGRAGDIYEYYLVNITYDK